MILLDLEKLKITKWEMKNMKNWTEEKKTLRSPLNLTENVLVLVESIRKKDAPGRLYKSSTENMPFLIETKVSLFIKEQN